MERPQDHSIAAHERNRVIIQQSVPGCLQPDLFYHQDPKRPRNRMYHQKRHCFCILATCVLCLKRCLFYLSGRPVALNHLCMQDTESNNKKRGMATSPQRDAVSLFGGISRIGTSWFANVHVGKIVLICQCWNLGAWVPQIGPITQGPNRARVHWYVNWESLSNILTANGFTMATISNSIRIMLICSLLLHIHQLLLIYF